MASLTKEFRDFINKGDTMNLAVGIIIGSAFTSIVSSLVKDIFMPVIGAFTGGIDFSGMQITIGNASITYGNFINAVVQFVAIAFVVFLIVRSMTHARQRIDAMQGATLAKAPHCPFCLEEVNPGATRCSHCGSRFDEPAAETSEKVEGPKSIRDTFAKKQLAE